MGEVIQFRGKLDPYRTASRQPDFTVSDANRAARTIVCESLCDKIMDNIAESMLSYKLHHLPGAKLAGDDADLVEMSVRSLIYRMMGVDHPVHDDVRRIMQRLKGTHHGDSEISDGKP